MIEPSVSACLWCRGLLFPPTAHISQPEGGNKASVKNEKDREAGAFRVSQTKLTNAGIKFESDNSTCSIIFLKAGSCAAMFGGDTTVLTTGAVLLLGCRCACTLRAIGYIQPETIECTFPYSFCPERYSPSLPDLASIFAQGTPVVLRGTAQNSNRLRTLLELMYGSEQEPNFPDKPYLALLFYYVAQAYMVDRSEDRPRNGTVEQVCAYLAANCTRKLTLSDVAAQFYLSPYYLSRLFRRVTGQSIVDYINGQRIELAQRLLEETDLSISAVAEQTGFSTAAHFRRVFRELLGVSPQQYRKNHGGRSRGF